jgi:uncharacterized sulfatase
MVFLISSCQRPHQEAPNVLLAIADDWSWPHASIAGTEGIHTPAFDRIARDGILFTHAYCSAPSCTPSRGALLTGQYHWRLGQNANLWSTLDAGFEVYPDLLEEAGYKVGYTGKGWGPGMYQKGGRNRNPAGPQFNEKTIDAPPGISRVDYSGNFKAFLGKKTAGQPFCFWFGAFEPHRVYAPGSGLEQGKDPAQITVPLCLPDDETVRKDIIDYYSEIEWFDSQLGQMIQHLEEFDLLEQTIIIVTSDNGMPFPRCKSNLYDLGTRVPLAIFMASNRKEGRIVEDLVSLTDLAPTILEAAGLPVPEEMTGQSLLPYFNTRREGGFC